MLIFQLVVPMPHLPRTLWTFLAFLASLTVCTAPLAIGVWLDVRWLRHLGWVIMFLFFLACYRYTLERDRRRREVREEERQSE
jgi:hypothetical protein